MAEIHVEPKKQASNSWIWIVLVLLIAAAVIYYFMTRNRTAETVTPPANTTGSVHSPHEIFSLKELQQRQREAMYFC
jgi:cytochrome c-type biogenesis protein CcmH/NrfF